ncbi:MAG TPA: prenyltransferase/squalene oxidase repeat-containing protein [Pirellulaceae bacterium]|nr:prenyltransferase/squalene oxidase repeat-containing protein [Pirellulaceae bacterium]
MTHHREQHQILIPAIGWVVGCIWFFTAIEASHAYTPDSPEIKHIIERGMEYLQGSFASEYRLGGKCLIGLCFWKTGRPIDHPAIQAAIKKCRDDEGRKHDQMYDPSIAAIFLCEMEAAQPELHDLAEVYLKKVLSKQKQHGGFGYDGMQTGDTSQTQYASLALWMAAHHGHQVPNEAVERLAGWLVRTQDPTGTWSYQGNDPGVFQRVQQNPSDRRLSLHVGGAGAMYIVADLLGLTSAAQPEAERKLPPALRAVGKEDDDKRAPRKHLVLKLFDAQLVRRALADGDQFFAKNYAINPAHQLHYYLYGLERYQSFRELAAGREEAEPKWYNEGCEMLMSTQQSTGAWPASGDNTVISSTFALLFLARSSKKSFAGIPSLSDGVLLGGMGLPKNTADIVERDGKLVETPLAGSIDELLALIEKPNAPLDQLIDPTQPLALDGDVTKRAGQITKLRALVSAGDFNTRLLAVKTLGRARQLDSAPILIYALTDPISQTNPDLRIILEADRGLRFLSRKFGGVGLPSDPKPQDIQTAIKAWKDWYKSIRPDAEFLD